MKQLFLAIGIIAGVVVLLFVVLMIQHANDPLTPELPTAKSACVIGLATKDVRVRFDDANAVSRNGRIEVWWDKGDVHTPSDAVIGQREAECTFDPKTQKVTRLSVTGLIWEGDTLK